MDLLTRLTVMQIRGVVNELPVPVPRRKTTGDLQNLLVNPGAGVCDTSPNLRCGRNDTGDMLG